MLVHRLIERKRDGGRLDAGELRTLINQYTAGTIPDYQMSAFLMACFFRGLDRSETSALTEAMLNSGVKFDLVDLGVPRVDKHSIGGVGDKVSLVLAPLVAAAGVAVPMVSGRGLGHTGGTLDKLESIPGMRTNLTLKEARRQIEDIGVAMLGQTAEIAPADKKLYALRDATSTVESIPLIASSIMSKKLAEDLTGLVIDIKRGSGAFLKTFDEEVALANEMIHLGEGHGCPVVAIVTAMDRPLGHACGHTVEVIESVAALKGEGPPDLLEVTMALAGEMLMVARIAPDFPSAKAILDKLISSGKALDRFRNIIERQGGDPKVIEDASRLPQPGAQGVYSAPRAGVVASVEPRTVGRGITELGGGRRVMSDSIDPSVGFIIAAKPGDRVEKGESLATIYAKDQAGIATGREVLANAITVSDTADPPYKLVSHKISRDGVREL